jgi:hypothetical protein
MTKSETREIARIVQFCAAGLGADYAARALSALIRAARTAKSANELRAHAASMGVTQHPEFIC